MVNYSDPGVVLGDLGAHAFRVLPRRVNLLNEPLSTAALHTLYLITNGIYLWVSLCRHQHAALT